LNEGGGRLADRSELIKDLIQDVDLVKMDSEHQAIFTGDPVAFGYLVHPFCFLDYFLQLFSLLPATATVIGIIILRQVPSEREIIGVALVIAGIAAHQPPDSQEPKKRL
jgi:hypothetical protein